MRTEPPLRTFLRTFVSTNGRRRPSYAPFFYFGVLFIAREGKCGAKRREKFDCWACQHQFLVNNNHSKARCTQDWPGRGDSGLRFFSQAVVKLQSIGRPVASMVVKNSGKWRVLCFLFLFLACVLFSLFCSGAYICERRQRAAGRRSGRGQGRAGGAGRERSGGAERHRISRFPPPHPPMWELKKS